MLLLIQLVLGIAFIGLLILSVFDAIRGTLIIVSGLVLLAVGYTLKGIIFIKNFHPAPLPVAPPEVTRMAPTWKIIPS